MTKFPSLLEQGKNIGKSIKKVIDVIPEFVTYTISNPKDKFNGIIASPDVYWDRIAICNGCERYDTPTKRCMECGCFLSLKAKLTTEECPLGKWNEVINS